MVIDVERLRKDLINYYGAAMINASPMALMEISKAERANEQDLIRMAQAAGLNLDRYQKPGIS